MTLICVSAEKAAQVDIPTDSQTEKKEEPLVEEVSTINGQVSVSKDGTITIFKDGKPVKITGKCMQQGILPTFRIKNLTVLLITSFLWMDHCTCLYTLYTSHTLSEITMIMYTFIYASSDTVIFYFRHVGCKRKKALCNTEER